MCPMLACASRYDIILVVSFCLLNYISFVLQKEYSGVCRSNIFCAGFSKPQVLDLMVNKYLVIRNHTTCAGTRSEQGIWVGVPSVICNCRIRAHVKTMKTNNLMNAKFVLNIM